MPVCCRKFRYERLEIPSRDDLYGHPVFGHSWEGWCIEQIAAALPGWQDCFFRDSAGEEIDLVMTLGNRRLAFEMKASLAPKISPRLAEMLREIGAERAWVVCPAAGPSYPAGESVRISGIGDCLEDLRNYR